MYTPTLQDIASIHGDNMGSICYAEIYAREWLASPVVVDPVSQTVITPLNIVPDRSAIRLGCLYDSMEYQEKPKTGRSGSYYEKTLGGLINKDLPTTSAHLNTLRYHELVVLYYDKNNQVKLIGNQDHGMRLSSTLIVEREVEGKSYYEIALFLESEHPSPFYIA